jgi:hypothetical protein
MILSTFFASAAFAASPYDVVPFALTGEEQRQVAKGDVVVKIIPLDGTAQSGVAIGTIAAPIDEVIKGIHDVNAHTKYFPRLMEARLVSGNGNVRVVHQKIDVPFPLQDRYYDVTTTASRVSAPRDVFASSWTFVKGSGNIVDTTGGWTLTPINARTTLAYYHLAAAMAAEHRQQIDDAGCDQWIAQVLPGSSQWLMNPAPARS